MLDREVAPAVYGARDTRPYRIISKEVVWQGFVRLTKYQIDLQAADGSWHRHSREVHDHGSGVACLLYNKARDTVLLTRQLRLPVALDEAHAEDFSIEVPAGLLEGADPKTRIEQELLEETGHRAHDLEQVYALFCSPGMITEKIHLFLGRYGAGDQVTSGGGLAEEGERIDILHLAFDEALAMCRDGRIFDAKTVILIQELALRRREG